MRTLMLGTLAFATTIGIGFAAQSGSTPRQALVPRAMAPSLVWSGKQFVRSDQRGNVFLLRGELDALDAYPLDAAAPGEPVRLQVNGAFDGEVSHAAVSTDGRQWVVATPDQVLFFQDGKQQVTPPVGWFVTSVAMLRDKPAVGVLPMAVGLNSTGRRTSPPPLVLQFDGREWRPLLDGVFPERSRSRNTFDALFTEHTVELLADARGRAWVIYPFTGKVLRLSPAGRIEQRITLGSGVAQYRDNEAQLQTAFDRKLSQKGLKPSNASTGVFTGRRAVLGATVAPTGELYLLLDRVLTGAKPLLARYDSVQRQIETAPVLVPADGKVSLAAGGAGLYMAPETGKKRWFLSWSEMDSVQWTPWDKVQVQLPPVPARR
jgi:hypothetical protein